MPMRQAERAIFDLRRGLPVLLRNPGASTLIHAIEGLDDAALADAGRLAGSVPVLILTRHRLASLGHIITDESAALTLDPLPDAAAIHRLACERQASLPATPAALPPDSPGAAALRLLRRAQLLPAALATEVAPSHQRVIAELVADGTLLAVDTAEAAALCQGGPGRLSRISEARVPLAEAEDTRFVLFREPDGMHEHVAIVIGDPKRWPEAVPVRLHSSCLTGDLFGSLRCDCGEQLRRGVAAISAQGGGILLYLSQEGRGIGLANKLRAYGLQDEGLDTIDADQVIGFSQDERDYHIAHEMLDELEVTKILLLTNNPTKVESLRAAGINVAGRQAIFGEITAENQRYLSTKAHRHGHFLHELLASEDEQDEPDEREAGPGPGDDTAA